MKTFLTIISILFINLSFAGNEGRFMKNPDIYKDKIVFTYEGDLWMVSSSGGTATRLTKFPGNEINAKFSPDGKSIAFTGNYDGFAEVYTIPSDGGMPKRITYVNGATNVAWTPDGEKIIFRSFMDVAIGRDPNLYFVNKDGSASEKLPTDRGRLCCFSPDGKKMLYTRKGDEEYYWKRYRGGRYVDIWMYDFELKKFTPISDFVGKNAYPMWIKNKMYFTSDRGAKGITNLYVEDLQTKEIKQVTNYNDFDVMMASSDRNKIVFVQNGYLNVFDTETGKIEKLNIIIPSDRWALLPKYINPKDYIHYLNISNDGKIVIAEARGDVFKIPTDKGQTINLSNTPGTREMYPQISPDGKSIAFFSDKTGAYQLYTQKIEGGEWTQLTTTLERLNYNLLWSPDSKKILFGNKDYSIFYIDVATKKLTKVDESHQMKNDEFYWEINDYNWSPDSKWICYSFVQFNRNSQIFVYNLDQNKKYSVTDDFFDNLYPSFDANGKYLYYVSSRNFDLQMDFYEDNHVEATPQQVMVVQLRDGEKPLFAESVGEEKKSSEVFKIDIEGIKNRTYPLPVPAGNYFFLKAGKNKVAWCSVDKFTESEYEEIFKPGGATKWTLHIFDIESKKEAVLTDPIREFSTSTNGENLLIRKENDAFYTTFEKAFSSKNLGDKINYNGLLYFVDPQKEWLQIFDDAWRWYKDFFYDANMHGQDWKAVGDKYREYIPYLSSRSELNWVLEQLVGELCVSHTYVSGGDFGVSGLPNSPLFTGWLGADLVPDKSSGYYQFNKIYGPTEYNLSLKAPLSRPDIEIKEGYYLIAINGTEIKSPEDYNKYLQVASGMKVSVTINSKPTKQGASTYNIEPIRNDQNLKYFRWLTDNIKKVDKLSNGKLGYMHINAMGAGGVGEFDKFWRAFRYKDGIIIDVRRNGGGWTEYFMIDKLERKMTSYNVLRGMEPFRYPGSTSTGQYVAITNEYCGSDGEAFVDHFQARKLGKVVGVPSWGGLVGILNGQTTIDNGTVQQSNNAFWGADGKWIVENHGADPDIVIDNDPQSVLEGKDPQLEKAIEVALEGIKKNPFNFAPQPAYPKK